MAITVIRVTINNEILSENSLFLDEGKNMLIDEFGRDYGNYFSILSLKQYNIIGTYWERDNQNEIDIVAVNELKKKLLVAEVKRNTKNIRLKKLKEKPVNLTLQFKGYDCEYKGFSIEDM